MAEKIILVRSDDTDFLNQVLLCIGFKTVLNLDGYIVKLTIENPTNIMRKFEVQNNSVEINLDKIITSTISTGVHKANIKLIDTLSRVKTTYVFEIEVKDEFDPDIKYTLNEYEIEIDLDTSGISKYKNYNELYNKPSINSIELIGDKTLEDLGITEYTEDFVKSSIKEHNENIESHKFLKDQIDTKQDKLIAGSNITIIDGIISALGDNGGVTTDYEDLGNKPKINDVTLVGSLTLDELGIQAKGEYITKEILDEKGFLTSVPSGYVTEEELKEKGYLEEIPEDYFTDTKNEEKYFTKVDAETKQNKLTAGDNIVIESDTISATIPDNYATKDLLSNYVNNEQLNTALNSKQNTILAGDNIRLYKNIDGTYTISAIDSKNPSEIVSYNSLSNLPTINNVALLGNKTAEDLGLQKSGNYQDKLVIGENINIVDNGDGTATISVIIPDNICTDIELETGLSQKADKATSLIGYNIQDAYNKTETDTLIKSTIYNTLTDVILSAPNGVLEYTEDSITLKKDTDILFSNGLKSDFTYNNIETLVTDDVILSLTDFVFEEKYKDFYVIAINNDNTININIISKKDIDFMVSEIVPKNKQGYCKLLNTNQFYYIDLNSETVIPKIVLIKILGEGTATQLEDGKFRITSLSPTTVLNIINKDELVQNLNQYQRKFELGENFSLQNDILNYKIPDEYVTKTYLINNDYATKVNIVDMVNIHNTNDLSHEDIRNELANKANKNSLSSVAFSGSYNELNNKPFIPQNVSELNDNKNYVTQEQLQKEVERLLDIIDNKLK